MNNSSDSRSLPAIRNGFRNGLILGSSILALTVSALIAMPAQAQDADNAKAKKDDNVVVVTGFRSSVRSAIAAKKLENDIVDVIKAEDIGKFPDSNLAESLQRIPGVAIDKEGGEGKTITVRGLGPDFTRVRLNGLEAIATTGGRDAIGGANRGRGFDFNVFASELFNSITVRKSLSAEIEEGSLGATVDLRTARPFDYKGFTMGGSVQGGYNDLSKKVSERGTFMVSNRWLDGKLGGLFSVAYSTKDIYQEGPNSGRWQNAYSASNSGRFQSYSTDGGKTFTAIAPCTSNTTTKVCNTTEASNPTVTGEAYNLSRALFPRFLRNSEFITNSKRLGMTGSLQFRLDDRNLFTLDVLHSIYDANRTEYNLEPISFSRNTAGLPQTDIYNYTIDTARNVITKASFNDVDIRSEMRFDRLKTTFDQVNFQYDAQITDKLSGNLLIGTSRSFLDNSEQTTFTFESYNVQGYSYDLTDMNNPVINWGKSATGCTIDQACYWTYAAASSTTASTNANGDASLIRMRPLTVENTYNTGALAFKYEFNDHFKLKFGGSYKQFAFNTTEIRRYTTDPNTSNEAAAPGSGIVTEINGNLANYSKAVNYGGTTYLVPDLDKIRDKFNYNCNCVNSWGAFTLNATNSSARANNNSAEEADTALYVQTDYNTDLFNIPVRGNLGVRYVGTSQTTTGYLAKGTAVGNITLQRSYDDVLPAFNMTLEPIHNLLVRVAAAKVMSRPTLSSLAPGGSISTGSQTLSIGNPYLDPIRAKTYDLSVEYYPNRDTMIAVSLFHKKIDSWIQSLVRTVPYSETGYDLSLLDGTGQTGATSYTVTQPINTTGGNLTGFEVAINQPFTFLPGMLKKTGALLNYTHVDSKINYAFTSTASSTLYREYNLLGMSPNSYNATLYYEGDKLSARVSYSHRDGYISVLNPGSSADYWSKSDSSSVDAQISYKFGPRITMVLEGQNLTNEPVDSSITYNTAQNNVASDLLFDNAYAGRQIFFGFRFKY